MNRFDSGNVTIVALGAIALVGASVSIAFTITANTTRIADRSQDLAIVQAAAEGAIEHGYGLWKVRLAQKNRAISKTEASDSLNAPAFAGASYVPLESLGIAPTNAYGAPGESPSPAWISLPDYPGWRGRQYGYVASVRMQGTSTLGSPLRYGVKRNFTYTEVPLFQAMFFFEHDFELFRSNTMNITGLTHTNAWGFVSNDGVVPNPVKFSNYASYVLGWTNGQLTKPGLSASDRITPYRVQTWDGYVENRNQEVTFVNGKANQLHQVDRLEPLGNDPSSVLDAPPSGPYSPSGQLIGPDGDSDGNPDNDSFHELIETPVNASSDPPEISKRRLSNKAGIVVTVNGTTETVSVQNGTTLSATAITTIKNAISPTTIYDKREQSTVRVQNVDLGAIRTTLNTATGFNGVVYIQDITATTSTVKKNAIRLQKGGQLPDTGLTVASPNGIYIQGDYNTGTTTNPNSVPSNSSGNPNNTDSPTVSTYTRKPAAVIGDAVMILSNAWVDGNGDDNLGSRVASNTTVNAALLGGFIPSGFKPSSTAAQYGYSGGANNYPRFLEDWSGKYFTYFGSMVELFQSTKFTGKWDTGDIYAPPIRCWNYDTNFDNNPPPGSIDAVATSRGTWARY